MNNKQFQDDVNPKYTPRRVSKTAVHVECDNPTPIKLNFRDWPDSVDDKWMTLEQHGALIQLVFHAWIIQNGLTLKQAKSVLRVRHKATIARLNLPALIELALQLTNQRAVLKKRDRSYILSEYNFKCHYCGTDLSDGVYHIDHAIPIARGGKNSRSNYRAACPDCNKRKRTLTESEFLAIVGGPHAE